MKKILLALLLACAFFVPAFADEDYDSDSHGFTLDGGLGFRLSILGLEPTAFIDITNFELEVGVPITSIASTGETGIGLTVAAGYNTNPARKGYANVISAEYMLLNPIYQEFMHGLVDLLSGDDSDLSKQTFHLIGISYKGAIRFAEHFGMDFKFRLPFVMFTTGGEKNITYNITQVDGPFWLFHGMMFMSTSIGLQVWF